ncbi:MAG: rod shape-determining protein [Armatimonadota bacterium]
MWNYFVDELMSKFSYDVGIDLGTANTPIIVKNRGIRLREPSYIAFDKRKNKLVAVGFEAKLMYGREPEYIQVIRPLKDGIINNFDAVQKMLDYYLEKIRAKKLFKPRVILGIPTQATGVERKAVLEAARMAGCRSAYLIEQTVAAALGAGLPVDKPCGCMILDIGGGTSEVSVISMGNVVVSKAVNIAGDEMDEAIMDYVKKQHDLLIGSRTAEEIKIFLGQAVPTNDIKSMNIRGRSIITNLPETVQITNNEIASALSNVVVTIGNLVKSVLEVTPPELSVDIMDNGICLAGGGSCLKGLDKYLSGVTGVRCYLAPEPSYAVAYGLNKIFNNFKLFKTAASCGRYATIKSK